jgi:hypothetical protein
VVASGKDDLAAGGQGVELATVMMPWICSIRSSWGGGVAAAAHHAARQPDERRRLRARFTTYRRLRR